MKPDREIALLLAALDEAFDRRSWHGTNLLGSLRSVPVAQALWRPAAGRHNIWELAVHAAYWKYTVWRTIAGAPRGSFPLKGSNWFPRSNGDDAAWLADLRLLKDQHRALRDAVASL
ncbi:MAG: DinB family protein, partial [Bryobacterales bacterium]|nr:DinB family protein [Bryobacterales bacterium]